jgi:hypothetical protein
MRVGRLTVWALPVIIVGVLAAASALQGPVVAAVVLGFIVALGIGWAVGVGLDPAKKMQPKASAVLKTESGRGGSLLSGADLSGADLTGADLRGLDLRDVKLNQAILRDADLRGARLSQEPDK